MPITTKDDTREKGRDDIRVQKQTMDEVYAKFNEEVAKLMGDKDKIVFGPVEDFEYKVPLEDFQKTRQGVAE